MILLEHNQNNAPSYQLKEVSFNELRHQIKKKNTVNPITGEEFSIQTDYQQKSDFKIEKDIYSNKSRRLARILENFNKVDNFQNRSRSSLKTDVSLRPPAYSPIRKEESDILQRVPSTRKQAMLNREQEIINENIINTSINVKESQLPSLSQRKLNKQNESFKAYEDNKADFGNLSIMKSRMKEKSDLKTNTSLQDKILFRNIQNDSNLR